MRFAISLLAFVLLAACSTTYPVVGRFDDHNEVFLGTVHADMRGNAYIQAKTKSGVTCSGNSRMLHKPVSNILVQAVGIPYCAGQRGDAYLRCSNGRVIAADWVGETCTSGTGTGYDTDGNRFQFVFGMSEAEAQARFEQNAKDVADKPPAPGYVPKEARKRVGYATGTGFFVSRDGHLITNHHVVEDSKEIHVLFDAAWVPARLLANDPANDLALLKIDAATAPLPVDTSPLLRRADEVFTLGYPSTDIQGVAQKATFGRINALSGLEDDVRYLQIDVPIQPGNSGGPLIDARGAVVGVITSTAVTLGVVRRTGRIPQNVNYAVKSGYLAPIVSDLPQTRPPPAARALADLVGEYERSVVWIRTR